MKTIRVCFAVYGYVKVNKRHQKKFLYFIYRSITVATNRISETAGEVAGKLSRVLDKEVIFWREVIELPT